MIRLPWSKKQAAADPGAETEVIKSGPSRMRRSRVVLAWFVTAAVVAVMIGVIGFVTIPRAMGWQGVIVLSGSMEPQMKTGGLAFVEPTKLHEVAVGDVLTFRREGMRKTLVSHRVVDIQQGETGLEFTTQGDANTNVDSATVKETQVIGVVHWYVPFMGTIIDSLHDRQNYYLFIGIPAALLILSEVWSIGAELRKTRTRKDTDTEIEIDTSRSVEGALS